MERLEYSRYGGPDVVKMATFELPPLKGKELLIRVVSASINAMDWKIRNGVTKVMTGSKFPRGIGTDYAGVVEAIGPDVTRFKQGDAVLGTVSMKNAGTFATRVIAPEEFAVLKPQSLSFDQAAALPIAGVTAWQALVKVSALRPAQKLFINGAAGGVGQAAVGIARALGVAEIVGRVNNQMVQDGQALGLDRALDYKKPIPDMLRGQFNIVFDIHGGLTPRQGDQLTTPDGKVIDVTPSPSKIMRCVLSRKRKWFFADMNAANLQQVVDLAAKGALQLPVLQTVTLEDVTRTMTALERGCSVRGKVVVKVMT
jgi:NADPH:quinone reductase-like Zn-dependent oxidoreductase